MEPSSTRLRDGRDATAPPHGNGVPAGEPTLREARERGGLLAAVPAACDRTIDFFVLAFAVWTAAYHVWLAFQLPVEWAGVLTLVALAPCAWFAFRRARPMPIARRPASVLEWSRARVRILVTVNLVAALVCATVFAWISTWWLATWGPWLVAAAAALLVAHTRGPLAPGEARWRAPTSPLGTLTALGSAAVLGGISLFFLRTDGDDTQYVHLSSWVSAHGTFPLRDTLFSDEKFPAVIYPVLSSFEGLAGTVSRFTGISAPALVYLGVTPVASIFAVLALWRLLRAWRTPLVAVAIVVALVFVLWDAGEHRTLGNLFVTRIWQGKIVFLAVLLPILVALLNEYVERPTRRKLVILFAAGAAGVGLTSTGVFVVPMVAFGCLAPFVARWRELWPAFLATIAYPIGTGIVTLAVGGHNADVYTNSGVRPAALVHRTLGHGTLAFVGMLAVLVGPLLLRRASSARLAAGTTLWVGLLFTPHVTLFVFHRTGLGAVLWRWVWAMQITALVGVLAVELASRIRWPALRLAPAAAVCALVIATGTSIATGGGTSLVSSPTWKRSPASVVGARLVMAHARPGDTVLAPSAVTHTLAVMSGRLYLVSPRAFYTSALAKFPGSHSAKRLMLADFANLGLRGVRGATKDVQAAKALDALRLIGVDVTCLHPWSHGANERLRAAGWSPDGSSDRLVCYRKPR